MRTDDRTSFSNRELYTPPDAAPRSRRALAALARSPALEFVSSPLPHAPTPKQRVKCQLLELKGGRYVLYHEVQLLSRNEW